MIDLYKSRNSIEKFVNDASNLKIDQNSSYIISYPEFLKYFSQIPEINKHNLIVATHFTYGWMPTIFDFRVGDFGKTLEILNAIKKGVFPSVNQIEILKTFLNNSMVGTSKLLHFINPEKFAIWDSRVYQYLTGQKAYEYRISSSAAFMAYLDFCDFITAQEAFDSVHSMVVDKVGYSVTKYRSAELIMFSQRSK